MPWESKRQERWGNSPAGKEAMGEKKVAEFNSATKGHKLPDHARHSKHIHHSGSHDHGGKK